MATGRNRSHQRTDQCLKNRCDQPSTGDSEFPIGYCGADSLFGNSKCPLRASQPDSEPPAASSLSRGQSVNLKVRPDGRVRREFYLKQQDLDSRRVEAAATFVLWLALPWHLEYSSVARFMYYGLGPRRPGSPGPKCLSLRLVEPPIILDSAP